MSHQLDGHFWDWDRETDEVRPLTYEEFTRRSAEAYRSTNSFDQKNRVAIFKTDGVDVSTVFLGINAGWRDEIELFETMVFGKVLDQEQCRYRTAAEAREGHAKMVERVIQELEKVNP